MSVWKLIYETPDADVYAQMCRCHAEDYCKFNGFLNQMYDRNRRGLLFKCEMYCNSPMPHKQSQSTGPLNTATHRCRNNFLYYLSLMKFCQIYLYTWTYWPSQSSKFAVIKPFWLEVFDQICHKFSTKQPAMGLGVSCGARMSGVYIQP